MYTLMDFIYISHSGQLIDFAFIDVPIEFAIYKIQFHYNLENSLCHPKSHAFLCKISPNISHNFNVNFFDDILKKEL